MCQSFVCVEDVQEESDQQSKEKLSCLHSRLHQEVDKINRWKTQTEMEIKQKVQTHQY